MLCDCASASFFEKAKETVVVAGALPGVTVTGENLQLTPVFGEEQAKLIAWLKPYSGVTVKVIPAGCLPLSCALAAEADKVKSGTATTVRATALEVDA